MDTDEVFDAVDPVRLSHGIYLSRRGREVVVEATSRHQANQHRSDLPIGRLLGSIGTWSGPSSSGDGLCHAMPWCCPSQRPFSPSRLVFFFHGRPRNKLRLLRS